jgi:hypothetical protein
MKKRFKIDMISAENGEVGVYLRKQVNALSKNIGKLEKEVSKFKEACEA